MGMEAIYKLSVVMNMVDQMTSPMKNAQNSVSQLSGSMDKAGSATSAMSGKMQKAESSASTLKSRIHETGEKISTMGSNIQGVGNKLTSFLTTPALAAASALGGLALTKGFVRLTGIDDAKAKLMALGHDAENVASIIGSAQEAVKGTSYGMDAAATTAAGAVAAGVQQGEELTRYLSLVGDAAAIAGAEMSDMGSIINKVQTSGKAYTENLNQLADRGLPIFQWIGEAAGVTAEQVKEMAGKGEISSEMFLSAIEKNIGGAAKTMGENSFKAAVTNIGAAIGRIGANFLDAGGEGGGFFSTLKPLLTDFKNSLGTVEEKAKGLGEKFGGAFNRGIEKIKELKEKFSSLSPKMQNTIIKGVGIGATLAVGIGPALKVVGGLMSGFGKLTSAISFMTSPVGLIIIAIVALVAGFIYLWNTSESFRNFWITLFEQVKAVVMEAWQNVKPALQTLGEKLMELYRAAQPILEVLATIGGVVATVLLGTFVGALEGVLSALSPIIDAFSNLVEFVTNVINTIVALLNGDFSGAMDFASAAVGNLSEFFVNAFDGILSFLGGFANGFLDVVGGALDAVGIDASGTIESIKTTISTGLETVKGFFGDILGSATEVTKENLANMKTAYEEHGGGIEGVVAASMEGVKGFVTSGFDFVDNMTGGKLSSIKETVTSKMGGVASQFSSKMSEAKGYVSNQLENMRSVYESKGGGIQGASAAMMSGMQSNMQAAYDAMNNLTGGKLDEIRESFSSRLEGAKSAVTNIMESVRSAFSEKLEAAKTVVTNAIEAIKGFFNFSWSLPTLKLPHVSISGSFSINPPSVPKFGVSWYKHGGIMTRPTAFAASGNMLHVGGEAGPEAVLPLSLLWEKLHNILSSFIQPEESESHPTGADLNGAMVEKQKAVIKESQTLNSNKEVYKKEKGGLHIANLNLNVDLDKIEDLAALQKLLDELKDAQNGTDETDLVLA